MNEVRLESFTGQGQVQVTGRYGFLQDTDSDVTRSYHIEMLRDGDDEKQEYFNNEAFEVTRRRTTANTPRLDHHVRLDDRDIQVSLEPGSLMEQVDQLEFRPANSRESLRCFPTLQKRILPYLGNWETIANVQHSYDMNNTILNAEVTERIPPPAQVQWDPFFEGGCILSQKAGADIQHNNADSFFRRGFKNKGAITFSYDNFVTTLTHLTLDYNERHDGYTFNADGNLRVRINGDVFYNDGTVGVQDAQLATLAGVVFTFQINRGGVALLDANGDPTQATHLANLGAIQNYGNDAFLRTFDHQGYLRYDGYFREGNMHNHPAPVEYIPTAQGVEDHEFLPIKLWARAGPFAARVVAPANGAALLASAGNANANQAIQSSITELILWVRRPRLARGQTKVNSHTPAEHKYFNYYSKINANVQNVLPTSFSALQGRERNPAFDVSKKSPRTLGDFHVTWHELGAGATNTYLFRDLASMVITLDSQETYDGIQQAGPQDEFTLILKTGIPFQKPFPTPAQMIAGTHFPIMRPKDGRMLIRFQQRHGTYTNATRTITFHRTGAHGLTTRHPATGIETFPNGRPILRWEHDLFPRNAGGGKLATAGWCPTRDAFQINAASIDPDHASRRLALDFTDTPAVDDHTYWESGQRPLFVRRPDNGGQNSDRNVDFFFHPAKYSYGAHAGAIAPWAFWNALTPLEQQAQRSSDDLNDELFIVMNSLMSGKVETDVPIFESTMYPTAFRNQAQITQTEPFFGFYSGMSTYEIDRIWKPRPSYPLLLQDYNYQFREKASNPRFFGSGTNLLRDSANAVIDHSYIKIHSTGDTDISFRSRRIGDQTIKNLQTADYYHPLIEEFETIQANPKAGTGDRSDDIQCPVSIRTLYGIPDYIFIYAERIVPDGIAYRLEAYPLVKGVDFRFKYSGKQLAPYLQTEFELWKATRKNATRLTSTEELHNEKGAVFLSKRDIGFWGVDELTREEVLELEVNVTIGQRESPGDEVAPEPRFDSPVKVKVAFIYEDRVFIAGTADQMKFIKIR